MESKLRTDETNSLQLNAPDHLTLSVKSNDETTITNGYRKDSVRKTGHSWFEWTHLIATICIPIIIAIYTIVDNNRSTSIADSNRRKDLEISNLSRASEFEIAQANRLNELIIAERSREKDRELALDQQRQNILVEYQDFLGKLVVDKGITFQNSSQSKIVARSMTITALSQLDAPLRGSKSGDGSILGLERVDLRDTIFSLYRYSPDEYPDLTYNYWNYLWLPGTILTNASFRYVFLDCANFHQSRLDSVDLSFASVRSPKCFDQDLGVETDFTSTSLVNASLYGASFTDVDFSTALMIMTDMRYFYCKDCVFSSTILVQADLSFCNLYTTFLERRRIAVFSAELRQVFADTARFHSINFTKSNWSDTRAPRALMTNCTFSYVTMKNCSFTKSTIERSVFQNARLHDMDFSDTTLRNVSFVTSDMLNANLTGIKCYYCNFRNVQLQGAILKNASFLYSNFLNSGINDTQLEEVINLAGTTLPNGTVVLQNSTKSLEFV